MRIILKAALWTALAAVVAVAALLEWQAHQGPAAPLRSGPVVYVPAAATTVAPTATPSAAPTVAAKAAPAQPAPVTAAPTQTAAAQPQATSVPVAPLAAGKAAPSAHVPAAPDAPPQILSLALSRSVARAGQVVTGTVETSSNVASVVASIGGYVSPLTKTGVGHFVLSYRVPNLPFFLHRTFSIEVVARNTRGDAVSSSVPITIQ